MFLIVAPLLFLSYPVLVLLFGESSPPSPAPSFQDSVRLFLSPDNQAFASAVVLAVALYGSFTLSFVGLQFYRFGSKT